LVEKALRNLSTDGVLAKKEFSWPLPLTSRYYQPWLSLAPASVENHLGLRHVSFVCLGNQGLAKVLWAAVFSWQAQVRHNSIRFDPEGTPCIRCAPELGFLQGEPGPVTTDDSTLPQLPMRFLKAFLDVGLYESMWWARWLPEWVSNEPRALADNSYGSSVDEEPAFMDHVPFTTFYDIVKGSFIESVTSAHMDAIFKRPCFLVNAKSHVYYCMSGINTNHVYGLGRGGEEYLTEEGKKARRSTDSSRRATRNCRLTLKMRCVQNRHGCMRSWKLG